MKRLRAGPGIRALMVVTGLVIIAWALWAWGLLDALPHAAGGCSGSGEIP